jgi:hypothetical protein
MKLVLEVCKAQDGFICKGVCQYFQIARLAYRSLLLISITQSFSAYINDFRQAVRSLALEQYGYTFQVFDQVGLLNS